jgi:hypothetical protein
VMQWGEPRIIAGAKVAPLVDTEPFAPAKPTDTVLELMPLDHIDDATLQEARAEHVGQSYDAWLSRNEDHPSLSASSSAVVA